MTARAERRARGAFYTPEPVATALTALALDLVDGPARVGLDPACGAGVFLGALRAEGIAARGIDLDPDAVATAAATVPEATVLMGDALLDAEPAAGSVDLVVGNPPFLGQLKAGTALADDRRTALQRRQPWAGAYTDEAARFLGASLGWVRDGGVVAFILPVSVLSARDAAPVRRLVVESGRLAAVWLPEGPVFADAAVSVCGVAVVVDRNARSLRPRPPVRLYRGASPEAAGFGPHPGPDDVWGPTVASLLGLPAVVVPQHTPLDRFATATAGFRDEFYGLGAAMVDAADGPGPQLVTSGMIDPGHLRWGQGEYRIGGRRVRMPRLDPAAALSPRVARYVAAQAVPKVLIATQTRVVESVVDLDGRTVAMTPVLSVIPRRPADLHLVAAAVAAPPFSLMARLNTVGSGLSAEAIKLSAGGVLRLPTPTDPGRWRAAAEALARGTFGEAVRQGCAAYLADPGEAAEVFDWWIDRLPRAARREILLDGA